MTTHTHESFPAPARRQILEDDRYRCQICGLKGREKGGTVELETHHIEDDPETIDYHDPANGTTLCLRCHQYVTNRIPDDAPIDLDQIEGDLDLQPYDLEILTVLAQRGPSTVSEIVANIDDSKSETATRERLWFLMSHDQRVERLPYPLVDQDRETSEWGLPHQIDQSARGHIPTDKTTLQQRFRDEMVRWLLDYGLPRVKVADIMDVHERTTHYCEKRARAYRFPLGEQSSKPAEDSQSPGFQTLETFLTDASTPHQESDDTSTGPMTDETDTENSALDATVADIVTRLEEILDDLQSQRQQSQQRSQPAHC